MHCTLGDVTKFKEKYRMLEKQKEIKTKSTVKLEATSEKTTE